MNTQAVANMVEALEMAIDLLESLKTGKETYAQSYIHVVCSMCEEALAQPEQEPVAWMSPDKRSRIEFARKDTVYGSHTIPLYTKEQLCNQYIV